MKKIYLLITIFLLSTPAYASVVIDFDKTVFIQFAIFIIFGLIIQRLIVNPVVDIIDRREEATTGSDKEVKLISEKIEVLTKDYDEKLLDARKKISTENNNIIEKSMKENDQLIKNENEKVKIQLKKVNQELESEKLALKKELDSEIDNLATLIVEKVMG